MNTVVSVRQACLWELAVMSIPSSQALHNALHPGSLFRSRHTLTVGLTPKLQPLTHRRNSTTPSPRGWNSRSQVDLQGQLRLQKVDSEGISGFSIYKVERASKSEEYL